MKENMWGQKYIDESEESLLLKAKEMKDIIELLDSNDKLLDFFKKMNEDDLLLFMSCLMSKSDTSTFSSYEDILKIFYNMDKIAIGTKEFDKFKEFITYMYDLFECDSIHNFVLSNVKDKNNMINSFLDLKANYLDESLGKKISSLESKRLSLENECNELLAKLESMRKEVEDLAYNEEKNKELIKQNDELEKEISDKKEKVEAEVDDLRHTLEDDLYYEMDDYKKTRKKELDEEISALIELKISLEDEITSLLYKHDSLISSECKRKYFAFESINSEHDLYSQNHWTIDQYYNSLVIEYAIRTGLQYEEAKKEFDSLCGTFLQVVDKLRNSFNNERVIETSSLKTILSTDGWNAPGKIEVNKLHALVNGVRLPNYKKKIIPGQNDDVLNSNIDILKLKVEIAILKRQLDSFKKNMIFSLGNVGDQEADEYIKRL